MKCRVRLVQQMFQLHLQIAVSPHDGLACFGQMRVSTRGRGQQRFMLSSKTHARR